LYLLVPEERRKKEVIMVSSTCTLYPALYLVVPALPAEFVPKRRLLSKRLLGTTGRNPIRFTMHLPDDIDLNDVDWSPAPPRLTQGSTRAPRSISNAQVDHESKARVLIKLQAKEE
jgi:hypothetical protein